MLNPTTPTAVNPNKQKAMDMDTVLICAAVVFILIDLALIAAVIWYACSNNVLFDNQFTPATYRDSDLDMEDGKHEDA